MAKGYHRLSFRARHLIRQLRRTRSAVLQRLHLHELRHAISRKHGFRGPKKTPDLGPAGHFRPLTRRARQLLTRLRKARAWSVQKNIVNVLEKEIERGRYLREKVRALPAVARGARAWHAAGRGARRAGRGIRAAAGRAGRAGRAAWRKGRPHLERAGRAARERARKAAGRERYRGPFPSARAHRRWGRGVARREVPGVFARFAARRGWTRVADGHHWTPAARRLEGRARRPTPGTPAPARVPRAPSASRTRAPARPAPKRMTRTRT